MDTNLKDRLIQERFPTIMAPRYEDLSPCPLHQTRLLIARGGLYIDTLQPFGAFRQVPLVRRQGSALWGG